MTRYSVTLPPRVLAGMRRHAAAAAPIECCGALMGSSAADRIQVRTLIPLDNATSDPGRYLVEADTVLRLERQAACVGLHIVGFYHSHPTGRPIPSPADLDEASPGYVYVIVDPRCGATRAWRLRDGRDAFDELPLMLLAGAA